VRATLEQLSVCRAVGPADWQSATSLLREYVAWIRTATMFDPFVEQPNFAHELDDVAEHYSGRDIVLFIARVGEQAVGTLAVNFHPGGDAELKRMYVRNNARGLGIADALLAAALTLAADRRSTNVWLETVRGAMDTAISVYRRNGFCVVEDADPTIDVTGVVVMRHIETTATATATATATGNTWRHGGAQH
jgi:ribosomal protein S18 acetylase RimI-like enzyme